MFNSMKKNYKSKKGSGIFQFIVVMTLVAIVGYITFPQYVDGFKVQTTHSIKKVDELEKLYDSSAPDSSDKTE